jgi:NDP-sugar pyrophosphorylase family protein
MVLNGDLVTEVRIASLLEFHERGGFAATTCVRPYHVEIPYGVASVDGDRLVSLREKPTEEMLINTGIYVLSPATLARIPAATEFPITDLFESCLVEGLPVGAYTFEGEWIDVGRHDELRKARGHS